MQKLIYRCMLHIYLQIHAANYKRKIPNFKNTENEHYFFCKKEDLKKKNNNDSYKIASCFAELTVVSVMGLLNYL